MVLFQRCALKNLILPSPYCRGWGVLPASKSYIPEFAFFLLLGHRCTGYSTISGIPGVRERTLIAVKPDGVQRRLVGQIMQRFEQRGFKLVGMKMLQASEELLSQHYQELRRKPFYPSLQYYMTSGPIVVMVWEGHNVVRTSRIMVGDTNPSEAQAGTVRGDFSIHISRNVVHASDSVEGAQREIQLWFHRKELMDWDCYDHNSTYQL
ncbi:nucleoside diphosphate kinase, mitochondrial isoform X1 [Oncorhynchus nerka]|uniref:nucleoside diphosphate kinase, mitochondrial isoform X1 n=1 Tax=Oncorhynchus nerka TaxID=8023 RepID=UPI001132709D|nr:nucleoside diphosphate kinase-like [Oncorhynchus nerka]XP_029491085.1 nucleoside diphosphate kinase-like [Oncorhynchus nerka]